MQLSGTRLVRNRSGYYQIAWTEPDSISGRARTRTYSCRTKDRAVAESVRRTWLTATNIVNGLVVEQTIGDLITKYLQGHVRQNGVSASQEWSLRPVLAFFGSDFMADLTIDRINIYRGVRAARVKGGTVRRELGALRAALTWCAFNGVLPAGTVLPHIPLPPMSQPRENYLSEAEERRMWAVASRLAVRVSTDIRFRRTGLFICIALGTGARSAAIEGLTWDRVDLDRTRGSIDFRLPGRKLSRKRRVVVPLSQRLRPVLLAAKMLDPGGMFVLGTNGSTRRGFEMFREKHGFDCTRHDLRRTFATLKAQRGVSMFDLAGLLGDNPETVSKHYAHHAPDHLRTAANA